MAKAGHSGILVKKVRSGDSDNDMGLEVSWSELGDGKHQHYHCNSKNVMSKIKGVPNAPENTLCGQETKVHNNNLVKPSDGPSTIVEQNGCNFSGCSITFNVYEKK